MLDTREKKHAPRITGRVRFFYLEYLATALANVMLSNLELFFV
jgi:hypothetical protein